MAEKKETEQKKIDNKEEKKSGETEASLSSLFKEIKQSFNDFLEKSGIMDILRNLGFEVGEVISESKTQLNELSKKLINIELDKLNDKEIDIEGDLDKLDDETTVLGLIARNDENLKFWFEWLKDVDDEDVRAWEIEMVLLSLREISDNNGDQKGDLTEDELKEIGENIKKKMELCDKVLKTVENDNNIPEEKRTKKSILEAYNTIFSDNKGKISEVTEEKIIDKLKNTTK